jgi:creatinine amidohydrolase
VPARVLQDLIGEEATAACAGPAVLAILPLGSTEYHGPRGPYGTDTDTAWEIARRVADRTSALLLPVLPFGYSPLHAAFPGTIHLGAATLRGVLEDVAASLYRHGVRRLLIILGHWDNDGVAREVQQAAEAQWPGMRIDAVRAFDQSVLDVRGDPLFAHQSWSGHGGAVEVSVSLYARPHVRPPSPEKVAATYPPLPERRFEELGWQGLPEEATADRGERAADITAEAIVCWLQGRL